MRRVLHYTLRLSLRHADVVAVTTVKGSHWWGRTVEDDVGTHGRTYDTRGEFATLEEAESMMSLVRQVWVHFHNQHHTLDRAGHRLRESEKAMISQVISGYPQRDAAWLRADVELITDPTPPTLMPRKIK